MKLMQILLVAILALGIIGCGESDPGGNTGTNSDVPRINIDNSTGFEGSENSNYSFLVRLSAASDQTVSVDYETEANTAGIETDVIARSGTLTFSPGSTMEEILIEVVGDTLKEEDESFNVILSNPQNATIANGTAIGTIRNDDTFVFVPEDGYITPEEYDGWNRVWSDEFNGTTINESNWTHELGNHGWGNQELQNYTADAKNSYISDGKLIIEAVEDSEGEYSSARMITADKQEFTFGRVDIRAKLPYGQGIWPALWMLGANFYEDGWPSCGEIDIMELLGHESEKVHGTAHWGNQGQSYSINSGGQYSLNGGNKFEDEFHVFSILWEFNSVKFLVDDEQYFQITPTNTSGFSYPFNGDFFFIMNIAVGGQWPGYPDGTTQFPQRMFVDYVRVFQKI